MSFSWGLRSYYRYKQMVKAVENYYRTTIKLLYCLKDHAIRLNEFLIMKGPEGFGLGAYDTRTMQNIYIFRWDKFNNLKSNISVRA